MLARSPSANKNKPVTLGQKIAEKRNALGISQAALAKTLEINQSLVSAIERGLKRPDGNLLRKISAFLNEHQEAPQEPTPKLAIVEPSEDTPELPLEKALRLRNEMLALIATVSPVNGMECYLWFKEHMESK